MLYRTKLYFKLLYKEEKNQMINISILNLILCFITLMLLVLFNNLREVDMPKNYVYVYNIDQIDSKDIIDEQTVSIEMDSNLMKNPYLIKTKVDNNNLKPIAGTTNDLIKEISNNNIYNNGVISIGILYNYNSKLMNKLNVENETYNISEILSGGYPQSSSEVMIPESLALSLVNERNLKSYDEILNTNIKLTTDNDESIFAFDKNYKISGIYSGGNNVIINPNSKIKKYQNIDLNSGIAKFDDLKSKKSFIERNQNTKLLYKKIVSIKMLIKLIMSSLIFIIIFVMWRKTLKKIYLKLNIYKVGRKVIIVFWEPILLLVISEIIIMTF